MSSTQQLPTRFAAFSPCFRKEAGSYGKDNWGIFRVHQFEKVEQFCVTSPEESKAMHLEMLKCAEEFYQSLKLPYQVVTIVSGEVGSLLFPIVSHIASANLAPSAEQRCYEEV